MFPHLSAYNSLKILIQQILLKFQQETFVYNPLNSGYRKIDWQTGTFANSDPDEMSERPHSLLK